MKTKLLIASLFIISGLSAQWVQQTSSTTVNLSGIHCAHKDSCFVAGTNGTIRKTVNGSTWSVVASGVFTNMSCVKMYNSQKIWIGMVNGTFRHSNNNGGSWATAVGNTTHQLNDIFYLNDSDYVAVGGSPTNTATGGFVFDKTINAGANWSALNVSGESTMFGIHCFNDTHYVAVGGTQTVYRTLDGGANWTKRDSGATTSVLFDVHFPTASVGYVVGGTPTAPTTGGVAKKSIDGGNTWLPLILPIANTLYGVHFVNADTGFVVGNSGVVMKTMDGGLSWVQQVSTVATDLNKVVFLNDTVGYAAGNAGVIIKTTNGGYPTAVGEFSSENSFTVYGNPTRGELMIETNFNMQNASLIVVNSLGQQVEARKNISGTTIDLNTSGFTGGMYFFSLSDGTTRTAGKFIVD